MKRIIGIIFLVAFLTGCAGIDHYKAQWKTRIDPMAASIATFEADHALCAELAYANLEQTRNKRAAGAIIGALAGAAVGVATVAILGRGAGSKVSQKVAGLGALYGAGVGAATPQDHAYEIYGNCMINRGYQILW
jgi:uncharacterized protein YcfJ